jgi:hypothetical protein
VRDACIPSCSHWLVAWPALGEGSLQHACATHVYLSQLSIDVHIADVVVAALRATGFRSDFALAGHDVTTLLCTRRSRSNVERHCGQPLLHQGSHHAPEASLLGVAARPSAPASQSPARCLAHDSGVVDFVVSSSASPMPWAAVSPICATIHVSVIVNTWHAKSEPYRQCAWSWGPAPSRHADHPQHTCREGWEPPAPTRTVAVARDRPGHRLS